MLTYQLHKNFKFYKPENTETTYLDDVMRIKRLTKLCEKSSKYWNKLKKKLQINKTLKISYLYNIVDVNKWRGRVSYGGK